MTNNQVDREISATSKWAIGILLGLALQTGGFVWWFSSWSANVDSQLIETRKIAEANQSDVSALKQGASVILSREQLDDILSSRDIRITNIERTVERIEKKLDR